MNANEKIATFIELRKMGYKKREVTQMMGLQNRQADMYDYWYGHQREWRQSVTFK